jgi:hypothetical protein
VGPTDDEDYIEYVLRGMCADTISHEYVHLDSDESLYTMNIGDMYADLITICQSL